MNSFPVIQMQALVECFNKIVNLFHRDETKLLEAAVRSFANDPNPLVLGAGAIQPQLDGIRRRLERSADNYGRNVLIKWIEELHKDLTANGAIEVTIENFINSCAINLNDGTKVKMSGDKKWSVEWEVLSQDQIQPITIQLRDISIIEGDIVPSYIIQYVQQAVMAYKSKKHLTALALISIALEGTLRDALDQKGYTYVHGVTTEDVYDLVPMEIRKESNGFNVRFPEAMPRPFADFLTEAGMIEPLNIRIKRIIKRGDWLLEMRDVDYLKDFWSSDTRIAEGQINISGLGTALKIARNEAAILDNAILPEDTDGVMKLVRNNLIHLSGDALTATVRTPAGPIPLSEFAQDPAKVFDTIWATTITINRLYLKIAEGSL